MLLCASSSLYGEEAPDFPLEITADVITCEQTKNTCTAVTHVKVIYDDVNDTQKSEQEYNYTLTCDHLTVTFEKGDSAPSTPEASSTTPLNGKKIQFIHARDNVIVVRTLKNEKEDPLVIRADRATYDPKTEMIEFFDHVRIKDGQRAYSESYYASMNKKTGAYSLSNTSSADSKATHGQKEEHSKPSGRTKLILTMKKS